MSLLQLKYFLLLLLTLIGYSLIPEKHRKTLLIGVSLVGISWFNLYSPLAIILVSWLTYSLGKKVHQNKPKLLLGIGLQILVFVLEKTFFTWNAKEIFNTTQSGVFLLGLSFYALQNISFLLHKYREEPTVNSWKELLFQSIFLPKVFAGPILSMEKEIPLYNLNLIDLKKGVTRITYGLVKVLVIAKGLQLSTDSIFNYHHDYVGITLYTGVLLFFCQLYFNFSGFVDIAIGSARLFGISLPENFHLPLRSSSSIQFWQRWHITLLEWLGSQIYYPIAYQLRAYKKLGVIIAVFGVFWLSGLWSGFESKYLFCVSWFAILIILERLTLNFRNKIQFPGKKCIGWLITIHLLAIGFIAFKLNHLEDVLSFYKTWLNAGPVDDILSDYLAPLANGAHLNEQFNFGVSLLILGIALILEKIWQQKVQDGKVSLVFIHLLLILLLGDLNGGQHFIYMQF